MINLQNISKSLGDFYLKDINLTVYDNEYFVILGPTGMGKTVVLETIAGMYRPDAGDVYIDNQIVTNLNPEERNIGFVYQDYILFPHLNVKENITFGLDVQKCSSKVIVEKLDWIVSLLGIKHLLYRYPATLSGGEQQRVAIARALIMSPKVLLLDEPLSALDIHTKETLQQELKKIHNQIKTTTIHITHDFNEALFLADRIGIMHNGQIIQVGTPEEIFQKPQSEFVARFVGMDNIFQGEIRYWKEQKVVQINNTLLQIKTENGAGSALIGIRPENITIQKELGIKDSDSFYLKGRVKKIIPQDLLIKIIFESDITLTVLMAKQSFVEKELAVNNNAWAVLKKGAVHVF